MRFAPERHAAGLLGLIAVAVGAAVSRITRWWTAALVVAGIVAFLTLGLGPIGVAGPLFLLAGFGLMARDLHRLEPAASSAPDPTPMPVA